MVGLVAVLFAACASTSRDIDVPTGSGIPLLDHASVWDALSAPCRSVRSMELMVVFGGRTGETRLRRTRMRTAVAEPGSLRLEALAPLGAPAFVFVARPGEATLLLPRDRQVVRDATAPDLLYALAGLALDPDDVRALLTGCVVPTAVPVAARAYGTEWVAVDLEGAATIYARRIDGEPVVTVGVRGDLRVEYGAHVRGLPRAARIQAGPPSHGTDLSVELSRVNINTTIPPAAFVATVPDSFVPITLDDLRQAPPTESPPPSGDARR